MSTRLLLIRHGAHDLLGHVLCGRRVDVELNDVGQAQARALAAALAGHGVTSVQASPRRRARETAAPIAEACGRKLAIAPALDEIDFGAWAGARFADLDGTPAWRAWNQARAQHRPPGGEFMIEVQARVATWIASLSPSAVVAAVSHADVIKAAVCHALGLPIDQHARFDIDPGSITTLIAGEWGVRLERLNATA